MQKQPFPVRRGVKSLSTGGWGGGIKKIRTGGWWVTNLGELLLLGGQYPITSHVN